MISMTMCIMQMSETLRNESEINMFTSEYIKINWALSAKINARNQLKIYAFLMHKLGRKICQKSV